MVTVVNVRIDFKKSIQLPHSYPMERGTHNDPTIKDLLASLDDISYTTNDDIDEQLVDDFLGSD